MLSFLVRNKLLVIALLLAAVSAVAFQGSRGLYESTEGRYAECTRQTMAQGSFLEPVLNGAKHWTKPPLTYLCIATGIRILGNNTWGVRAYLAVAFVLTVLFVYGLSLQLWGKTAAEYSALVYATSPFPVGAANAVSTDTLLVLWECMGMAFFWYAVRRKRQVYVWLMWTALGLAVVTKGPMGVLPLIGILPTYIVLRRRQHDIPGLFNIIGLALFVVTGLGWYLVEVYRHPELFNYWVMHETFGRLVQGEFNRNPAFYKAFVIYLPVLLFGNGLWVFLLLLKARRIPWPTGRWFRWLEWQDGIPWTYVLLSFLVPLVLFSLMRSKLWLYVLPLFIPVTLAMGRALDWLVDGGHMRGRAVLWAACCAMLLLVVGKGVAAQVGSSKDMKQLQAEVQPVLEVYPARPLYVLREERLNGLQFYLERTIPPLLSRDPREGRVHTGRLNEPSVVLVRSKDLGKCQGFLDRGQANVAVQGKYWSVLAVDKLDAPGP